MSPPEPEPAILRGDSGPVFPTPWAARAFALAVALNERGVFASSEWAETLGAALRAEADDDPEAYWRAWLAALEQVLGRHGVASRGDLVQLQQAWRDAAERTPHGEAIVLAERLQNFAPPLLPQAREGGA